MSHFSTIKTAIVSKPHLLAALKDVQAEFSLGEARESLPVRGFGGQTTLAEVVVSTRNQGYDIGFRREGDSYVLVADWYGLRDIKQEELLSRVQQRYAYHVVREQLDQQGFALVEEEVREDRTIHLVLRRAV
mgnify:CR=1 FL=1